jgi:carboxylate-amine ligase
MEITDLTIGIEEEYQLIDPDTRELTSYISRNLDEEVIIFQDQVKPAALQMLLESDRRLCRNIAEVRHEVTHLRSTICDIAAKHNRQVVAAGTHPFSQWQDQVITAENRHQRLVADYQMLGRRLLVFGMHVHLGIPDPDLRIDVMRQMTYAIPHIFGLSTSSPFWRGINTGLKSYRAVVFEDLPRTGLPEYFDSAQAYDRYVNTLIETGCIDNSTKILWDIRPHPELPTLEFRMCDCVTKIDEVIGIAALIQTLAAMFIQLRHSNQTWRIYRRGLIAENKWRAMKDGVDGQLIDFGQEKQVPLRFLIEEVLTLVEDVADRLGTLEELEHVRTILKKGTSADRQLREFQETDSLEAVLDLLVEETATGCY